jgi:hypothetical protein
MMKALHPCGEEATGVTGIPDHVSIPVVTPEFRADVVITSIGTAATDTDDVDIFVLPFADLPAIWRRYKSGSVTIRSGDWNPVWNSTFDSVNKLIDADSVDATTGDPINVTIPEQSTNMQRTYGYGRATYKGVTVHLDAPALSDQGRLVAGQLSLPFQTVENPIRASGWNTSLTGPAAPSTFVVNDLEAYSIDSIPITESCLVQSSPGSAAWEAREGCYIPLRFRDPVHNFAPSGRKSLLVCDTNDLPNSDALSALRSVELHTAPPPVSKTGKVSLTIVPRMLLNLQTGVVLLRGISPTANVQFKTITGLEAMVETCSTVSPYQRMSPKLDCDAINMVARMSQELSQVYEAKYNDMGGMIGALIGVTKKIRGGLSKLPLIGGIWKWQNKHIYDPLGLNAPMRSPMTGRDVDPMRRVWDRMMRDRQGGGYHGMYA